MPRNVVMLFNNESGRTLIKAACKEKALHFSEFEELVQEEVAQAGKQRRAGLWAAFDDILDRIKVDD